MSVTCYNCGHILQSAETTVEIHEGEEEKDTMIWNCPECDEQNETEFIPVDP